MSEKIILLKALEKKPKMFWLPFKGGKECQQRLVKKKKNRLWLPKQQLSFIHIEAKKKKELEYHQGLCLGIQLAGYKMSIKVKFKTDTENKYKMQK